MKQYCGYCNYEMPVTQQSPVRSITGKLMCHDCIKKWPSRVSNGSTANSGDYFYAVAMSCGPSEVTSQLIAMLRYYTQRAIRGDGVRENYGNHMKDALFWVLTDDVESFPAFSHLWGHKIRIVLDSDNKICNHELVEDVISINHGG